MQIPPPSSAPPTPLQPPQPPVRGPLTLGTVRQLPAAAAGGHRRRLGRDRGNPHHTSGTGPPAGRVHCRPRRQQRDR